MMETLMTLKSISLSISEHYIRIWQMVKKNKLKKINLAQFYIQLMTATIFGYMSIRDEDVLKMIIAFLLLLSWGLGYWRHLIVRRRINNNVNPWTKR